MQNRVGPDMILLEPTDLAGLGFGSFDFGMMKFSCMKRLLLTRFCGGWKNPHSDPHPNPLPAYRERGPEKSNPCSLLMAILIFHTTPCAGGT